MEKEIRLEFYGVGVIVTANAQEILESLKRDFSYFLVSHPQEAERQTSGSSIHLSLQLGKPSRNAIPPMKASYYLSNAIVYEDSKSGTRYIDYHEEALAILKKRRSYPFPPEEGTILSEDFDRLYELAYLFVLSKVGECLERKGLFRVHALGVSGQARGILCLLPEGGGKSLLCLDLIRGFPSIRILSDDTPLVNGRGELFAFPLRLGFRMSEPLPFSEGHVRIFRRSCRPPKRLADLSVYEDRVAGRARLGAILIGERTTSSQSEIERIPRLKALWPLVRDLVFGLGIAQLVEYFLRAGPKGILENFMRILRRVLVLFALLRGTSVYRFMIGQDREKNAEVLARFLEKEN